MVKTNSNKVIKMVPDIPRDEVVNRLNDWLSLAKEGKLIGIAGIVLIKDSGPEWTVTGSTGEDLVKLLGLIEVFKRDVLNHIDASHEENGCDSDPTG